MSMSLVKIFPACSLALSKKRLISTWYKAAPETTSFLNHRLQSGHAGLQPEPDLIVSAPHHFTPPYNPL